MRKKKIIKILERHMFNYCKCREDAEFDRDSSTEYVRRTSQTCKDIKLALSLVKKEIETGTPIQVAYEPERCLSAGVDFPIKVVIHE